MSRRSRSGQPIAAGGDAARMALGVAVNAVWGLGAALLLGHAFGRRRLPSPAA